MIRYNLHPDTLSKLASDPDPSIAKAATLAYASAIEAVRALAARDEHEQALICLMNDHRASREGV